MNFTTNKPANEQVKKDNKEDKKPSKTREKLDRLMKLAEAMQSNLDRLPFAPHFNFSTKKAYSGKNEFYLEIEKSEKGYTSNFWIGYHQLKELGGHIKKGSEGCPVTVYSEYKKKEKNESGQEAETTNRFFRVYNVFNMDCVEIPEQQADEAAA